MKTRTLIIVLCSITILCLSAVWLLKEYSERTVAYNNRLNRLFPIYIQEDKVLNLKFDSFYFAGSRENELILGNYVGSLKLTTIDTALTTISHLNIELENPKFQFRSPQVRFLNDNVYFIDGTLPVLFKGKLSTPLSLDTLFSPPAFFKYQVADSSRIIYNYIEETVKQRNIGISHFDRSSKNISNPMLLETDADGLFGTDGHLMYDAVTRHLIYLYRYKNRFVISNLDLQLLGTGKTIDTVSKAQTTSKQLNGQDVIKMTKRPLTVNSYSFSDNGYLFVHSNIPGQSESLEMWNKASIIDIYDLTDTSYKASFYVYHIKGRKLKSFYVKNNNFYGIIGTQLVKYKIKQLLEPRRTIGR